MSNVLFHALSEKATLETFNLLNPLNQLIKNMKLFTLQPLNLISADFIQSK